MQFFKIWTRGLFVVVVKGEKVKISHFFYMFLPYKTLKPKYYLRLAYEEVNFREANNNMLCLLPNT